MVCSLSNKFGKIFLFSAKIFNFICHYTNFAGDTKRRPDWFRTVNGEERPSYKFRPSPSNKRALKQNWWERLPQNGNNRGKKQFCEKKQPYYCVSSPEFLNSEAMLRFMSQSGYRQQRMACSGILTMQPYRSGMFYTHWASCNLFLKKVLSINRSAVIFVYGFVIVFGRNLYM